VAHYLGHAPYDDKHSPRDSFISAVLTLGEGYHNFHHQFPMDYRNAFRWYQYDPTKWFIRACAALRLAYHLRQFPSNEIEKGRFTMRIKELKRSQDALQWPPAVEDLPIVTWKECAFNHLVFLIYQNDVRLLCAVSLFLVQSQARERTLILVSGFIHDATDFTEEHPGGAAYIRMSSGKDMTASFFGGVYDHSNAAHNVSFPFLWSCMS
jgi:stearoyl-CoA desaturase (Delta-9 desaturase)